MRRNLFGQFDEFMHSIKQQCFRVLKCEDGFIVVYPQVSPDALLSLHVSALSLEHVEYDLLREIPVSLLSAYCSTRALIEGWDGDFDSFPIAETPDSVLAEWYGTASQEDAKE